MNNKKTLCIIFVMFLTNCSNTVFTGTSKKTSHITKSTSEKIVIETTHETPLEPEKEDPGNLDEICFEAPVSLPETMTEPKELWYWQASGQSKNSNQVMALAVVGKIIGKTPSVIVPAYQGADWQTMPNVVYALDGVTGKQQWVSPVNSMTIAPALGDVNQDGKNEIVIFGFDHYVHALIGETGQELWQSSDTVTNIYEPGYPATAPLSIYPSLADIDEDGEIEILMGEKIFNGKTGQLKLSLADLQSGETMTGQINESTGLEILTAEGVYNGKTGTKICSFPVKIFHFAFSKMRSSDDYPLIFGISGCQFVCPQTNTGSFLRSFSGKDCSPVFEQKIPGTVGGGGAINLADMDGDGELEIGLAATEYYVVFKEDGSILWKNQIIDTSSETGSTTFDFNGDGKAEILYNDHQYLRVFEGSTGRVVYQIENSSCTLFEYPLVVDVDGDGHANIVVSSSNYAWGSQYGIRAFQAPDNAWINTRQVWNQHAYNITNIAENGSLTGFNPGSIWSKYIKSEYLLGFRNNLPIRPTIKCD